MLLVLAMFYGEKSGCHDLMEPLKYVIMTGSIQPDAANGLRKPSQVMVDKPQTVPRQKIGSPFGRLDDETLLAVNRALAVFLGFA